VRGANSDGIWSETWASLPFLVRPHFYETAWFRVALALEIMLGGMGGYSWRVRQIRTREKELEGRVKEAVAHIQSLKGLLPICAQRKKIRDDSGYWNQMETYIQDHSEADFSHSIGPECMTKLYPDYAAARAQEGS
jgi:hypothetical protein